MNLPLPLPPAPPGLTEAELVALAQLHDEAAVRELVRRCNPRLFRLARGLVGSDAEAEELVQETYVRAFTAIAGFRGASRFSTWLARIALNLAAMQRRGARPVEEYDTLREADSNRVVAFPGMQPEGAESLVGRAEVRHLLEAAIAALPPELRLVFLLREAEAMSVLAIARDLRLNPITVKTRLFRARRRLRATLEAQLQGGFEAVFPFDGARCRGMADRVVAGLGAQSRIAAPDRDGHDPPAAR